VHLEQELDGSTGDHREELLTRLADIYARLLEHVTDRARRLELEQRSRRLLQKAPNRNTEELQLALFRATFRGVERAAENYRLRLVDDEELDRARATLAELVPDLERLRRRAADRVRDIERRLSRSSGTDAIVLTEQTDQVRQLEAQCTFLTAWAMYYQSWLNDHRDVARVAERHFATLLDLQDQPPQPDGVSVDLRGVEAIARCILGMALCRSRTASSATAMAWLELLEHEQTYPPLRKELPAWRMVVHLEHGEYDTVRVLLFSGDDDAEPPPVHWLRLTAVHCLERAARSAEAAALATDAVTALASRGELEQVFDLAQRYGPEALATRGFAQQYVTGVLQYLDARAAHGNDAPIIDPAVGALYDAAIESFTGARRQRDAEAYPGARADCVRLGGRCHYFKGDLLDARNAFLDAASTLPATQGAEALWMAIVCLDRLTDTVSSNPALARELAELVDRFLAAYPASEHAPHLLLRRAVTRGQVSLDTAEQLLGIPEQSAVYEEARRRGVRMLYRLYRDSTGPQRIALGNRYLDEARILLALDERLLSGGSEQTQQRFVVRGRRMLEVALHEGIGRLSAAGNVLDRFTLMSEQRMVDLTPVEPELNYRRLQLHLWADDPIAAAERADALWVDDAQGVWTRLASRALFKAARAQLAEARETGRDDDGAFRLIMRYGQRVLEAYDDDPAVLDDEALLAEHAAVAEAAMAHWQHHRDPGTGQDALALYERLLTARPSNAVFLRSTAVLSGELKKPEQALRCWRILVTGLQQGTEPWYEAKYNLINLLARTDPARAREVLDQHIRLHPDGGPDPWGARLRGLDRRLERLPQEGDSPEPPDEAAGAGEVAP